MEPYEDDDMKSLALPLMPEAYEEWRRVPSTKCNEAYDLILSAEAHAHQQTPPQPGESAARKVVMARVVGYLLLELYNRRWILGDRPYQWIAQEVYAAASVPEKVHYIIYEFGERYMAYFMRLCVSTPFLYHSDMSHSL